MLVTIWRDGGPAGSARKLSAAIRLALPVLVGGRRSAAGVGAYFDLITDDARLFYGDNFHFGYFRSGSETLAEALDAHTDLVGEMARLQRGQLASPSGTRTGSSATFTGCFAQVGTSAFPISPCAPARRSTRTTR